MTRPRGRRDAAVVCYGKGLAMAIRSERISALTGVAAVVLWIVGVIVLEGFAGTTPEGATDEEILSHYRDKEGAILTGGWLFMLGSVFFLWFAGVLRSRIASAEGPVGSLAATAFAGAVATGVLTLLVPAPGVAAAIQADDIGPPAAAALDSVGDAFFVGAELAAIVLVVATALATLRTPLFPRWWAWVSILLAVWLVIGPIGWAGLLFGFTLWTIATSAMLAARTQRVAGAGPVGAATQ